MPSLLERLSALAPAAPAGGPPVCILPSAPFFVRVVERPAELPAREWASFAELTLESLAPFPLEQLAWGWHTRADSQRLIVFGTHRDRLAARAPDGWEHAEQALPGFLAVLGPIAARGRTVGVVVGGHLVIAQGDASDPLPAEIVAEPIAGPPGDEVALAAARQALASRLGGASLPEVHELLVLVDAELTRRHGVRLAARAGAAGAAEIVTELSEDQAWQADVREAEYKAAARRRRRTVQRADLAVAGALIAASLLLLLQFTALGLGWAGSAREQRLAEQADTVNRLQAKQALGVKIEQFSQQELQPLVMLEVLNRYRPRNVHFTRTGTEGFNILRLEGEAGNVAAVNTFNDLLSAAPEIAVARVERVIARDGRAPFTLVVTFEPGAFAPPSEVVAAAPPTRP